MQGSHEKRLRDVVREMDKVIVSLITRRNRVIGEGNGVESRAHILLLPSGFKSLSPSPSVVSDPEDSQLQHTEPARLSSVTEDIAEDHSLVASNVQDVTSGKQKEVLFQMQTTSEVASVTRSDSTITIQKSEYNQDDLPLEVTISMDTRSFWLGYGKVEYSFDVQDFDHGTIHVSKSVSSTERKVDARNLDMREELEMVPHAGENSLAFVVHERGENGLLVEISWSVELSDEML